MSSRQRQTIFFLGFTAIFIGYLMVWLPGPAAGLQFLGIEMGEWSKFLGVGTKRNWFYLPPLTLALMLLFYSAGWTHDWRKIWLFRCAAVFISLLAFPALEDLTGPAQQEYLSRLLGIGLVGAAAVLLTVLRGRDRVWPGLRWAAMMLAALAGLVLPTLIYVEVRPFAGEIMALTLGYGPGFWLNLAGHAVIALMAAIQLMGRGKEKHTDQPISV